MRRQVLTGAAQNFGNFVLMNSMVLDVGLIGFRVEIETDIHVYSVSKRAIELVFSLIYHTRPARTPPRVACKDRHHRHGNHQTRPTSRP